MSMETTQQTAKYFLANVTTGSADVMQTLRNGKTVNIGSAVRPDFRPMWIARDAHGKVYGHRSTRDAAITLVTRRGQ